MADIREYPPNRAFKTLISTDLMWSPPCLFCVSGIHQKRNYALTRSTLPITVRERTAICKSQLEAIRENPSNGLAGCGGEQAFGHCFADGLYGGFSSSATQARVIYIITQVILAFWLVLAYDLLDDRRTIDVIITKFFPSAVLKWREVWELG